MALAMSPQGASGPQGPQGAPETPGAGSVVKKERKPRTVKPKPFVIQQTAPAGAPGQVTAWYDCALPKDAKPPEDTAAAWALVSSNPAFPLNNQYRVIQVCGLPKTKKEAVVKTPTLV